MASFIAKQLVGKQLDKVKGMAIGVIISFLYFPMHLYCKFEGHLMYDMESLSEIIPRGN